MIPAAGPWLATMCPMSTPDDRIAQFENMATADPENEMAHFSLGNAYMQAERAAEAAVSFERCIELNPDMSKAYQLAGEALIKAGWSDRAVEVLNDGYVKAAERGDVMPLEAISALLESLGRDAPTISTNVEAAAKAKAAAGDFTCGRTGRAGTQLDAPPFKGPIGEWIKDNISAQTWQEWIDQGTKVINELRLDLSRDEDSVAYDQHMHEFLGVPDDLTSD